MKTLTGRYNQWLIVGGVILIIGCVVIRLLVQGSMIDTTRAWARLDPLPPGKRHYTIVTSGSPLPGSSTPNSTHPFPRLSPGWILLPAPVM